MQFQTKRSKYVELESTRTYSQNKKEIKITTSSSSTTKEVSKQLDVIC
jgi:hypothetical protein